MGEKKEFFSEIVDSYKQHKLVGYLLFFLGVILLWVFVAVPEQKDNATIYLFMVLAIGLVGGVDFLTTVIKNKVGFIAFNGLGKSTKVTRNALIVGAAAVFAIGMFAPQILIQPLSIVDPTLLSFLFIVIAAPFVEALFFRGTLQPMLADFINDYLKNVFAAGAVATVLQSLAFAWFHINIFGATGDFMPYFIFGVIATIGVYAFRSVAFEFSLHGLNNWFAFSAMTAVS